MMCMRSLEIGHLNHMLNPGMHAGMCAVMGPAHAPGTWASRSRSGRTSACAMRCFNCMHTDAKDPACRVATL